MRISATDTTAEILRELGVRVQAYRLQQNQTVEQLAREAGIASRTINRAEAGQNTSLETVVKLLRALGRLDALDAVLPPPLVSPIQLAELQGRERRRAYAPRPNRARRGEHAPGAGREPQPDRA